MNFHRVDESGEQRQYRPDQDPSLPHLLLSAFMSAHLIAFSWAGLPRRVFTCVPG
jgi:hypothetical protein